jgi:uncharacterized membrane protein YraQ (UPF0718 family)
MIWYQRFKQGQFQSADIFGFVWLYIVLGIAIGAFIHGYVPTDLITWWAGANNPLSVPVAVVIGVPLYFNALIH